MSRPTWSGCRPTSPASSRKSRFTTIKRSPRATSCSSWTTLQFQLALDRAEAQIGNTRNDLVALQASYRNMQAQVEQAQKDVDFNMVNFKRQEQLLANNFTPKATFDAARNTLQGSQQKLASLQATAGRHRRQPEWRPRCADRRPSRYKDAVAARDEAARQLAHTIVRAPFAGIVTNVPSLQPGQYLAAAAVAFNIVSTDHVWVQASPKETELTYVRPGQKVDGRRRYLSGRAMGRHGRQHKPGIRLELLAAAGARIPAATGSRSSSAFRCASASTMHPASRRCASA